MLPYAFHLRLGGVRWPVFVYWMHYGSDSCIRYGSHLRIRYGTGLTVFLLLLLITYYCGM